MGGFHRLGEFVYRLRWVVIGLWVVVLGVGVYVAPQVGERLSGGEVVLPDSESAEVQRVLEGRGLRAPRST